MILIKRILLFAAGFLIGGIGYSQNSGLVDGKNLSNKQLYEDYDILYSSLVNYHPTPFLYTSESDFKKFYEKQKAAFPDSLSEREFYIIARQLISQLKCGHTYGDISDTWNNTVKGKNILLPFEVKYIEGKVFIKNTVDEAFDFNIGDRLISINNVPVETILKRMDSLQVRDGLSQSFVDEAIAIKFRMYYLFLYGDQDKYLVTYISEKGEQKQTTVKSILKNMKESKRAAFPENFKVQYANKWSLFAVDSVSNIAYLKIVSFSDRKEFKKYYKQVFSYLKQFPSLQLVVDLRDNTGGYFGNGNTLLTYLTPDKFEFTFQRPDRKIEKNKYTTLDMGNKLTKLAFSLKPSKYKKEGQKTHTFTYKPDKLIYTGKVNVITNGITFSQAALVAAQLKENGATFYGTETGGNETSTNAMVNYKVILPNSAFKAYIAYYQVISNSTKGAFGFGLKPDFELLPSSDSTIDNVLMEALSLLSENEKN